MKQIFFNSAQKVEVHDVEVPPVASDEILIRVERSLISTGTETVGYDSGSLISRSLTNPSTVDTVLKSVAESGVRGTYKKIKAKSNELTPKGYSGAGIVRAVGDKISKFSIGDKVAYVGSPHSEYVVTKQNLIASIPEDVSYSQAAFGAIGCIAMHGVRLGEPTMGETCMVVGLGLVGLLTAQLARVSGLEVICLDPNRSRREIAKKLGFNKIIDPASDDDIRKSIYFATGGLGSDIAYLCAGVKDSSITNEAISCIRNKGRVIMIGDMGLDLERGTLFRNEVNFMLSRSYGPGRYDKNYEKKNLDYPIGYVRWTEKRNLEYFLRLLDKKVISVDEMISAEFFVDDAESAYDLLKKESLANVAILLSYSKPEGVSSPKVIRRVNLSSNNKSAKMKLAVIGCGSFVQKNLIPHFEKLGAQLFGVSNRTNKEFSKIRALYNPSILTTQPESLISNDDVDGFIVATHHDSHAYYAKAILEQGKPVYVEKPLAMTLTDSEEIGKTVAATNGLLTIGYNRRSSRYIMQLREALSQHSTPKQILYRINTPALPPDHWILDAEEGGGRLVGEGCHFIDLVCYLANSEPTKVTTGFIGRADSLLSPMDNWSLTLRFANGDIGTIVYSGQGNTGLSKEYIEVFVAGRVFVIDDYQRLYGYGVDFPKPAKSKPDKGFKNHMQVYIESIQGKSELIVTVDDGIRVARVIEQAIHAQDS